MYRQLISLLFMFISVNAWSDECPAWLNVSMKKLHSSQTLNLCQEFRGKVILAVNTASNCGFTPQFKGLETLYKKFKDQGLVVLGFPSNDFKQEFDAAEKTAKVCFINYGVTFPMFETSQVTGKNANPLFLGLNQLANREPNWNFNKYLIDPKAQKIQAFESSIEPDELAKQIEALLTEQSQK